MSRRETIGRWPVLRQITEHDPEVLGAAARSRKTETLRPRITDAERKVASVCPAGGAGGVRRGRWALR
ncbi:MAG: hypothetical protein QOF68_454 [Gaiellales bacterium]|jgi:formate dehydrogenase major subunit|nr:hypothetical protein [Gaiellales bacterium]